MPKIEGIPIDPKFLAMAEKFLAEHTKPDAESLAWLLADVHNEGFWDGIRKQSALEEPNP